MIIKKNGYNKCYSFPSSLLYRTLISTSSTAQEAPTCFGYAPKVISIVSAKWNVFALTFSDSWSGYSGSPQTSNPRALHTAGNIDKRDSDGWHHECDRCQTIRPLIFRYAISSCQLSKKWNRARTRTSV